MNEKKVTAQFAVSATSCFVLMALVGCMLAVGCSKPPARSGSTSEEPSRPSSVHDDSSSEKPRPPKPPGFSTNTNDERVRDALDTYFNKSMPDPNRLGKKFNGYRGHKVVRGAYNPSFNKDIMYADDSVVHYHESVFVVATVDYHEDGQQVSKDWQFSFYRKKGGPWVLNEVCPPRQPRRE